MAHVPEVLQFIRDHKGPRVTETRGDPIREGSKAEAYRLAVRHLKAQGLLNRHRGDGLAIFLISTAHELVKIGEVRAARAALWTATRYAGSPGVKVTAFVMRTASLIAGLRRKNQVSALNRAQLLVGKMFRKTTGS